MQYFLSGKELYGDNFSFDEIEKWYEDESEGYANLGSKDRAKYKYGYNELNKFHGYNRIGKQMFENVLGFGSAYGKEFEPIIERIKNLVIIEPSDQLMSHKIGNILPTYIKPNTAGNLDFTDNTFDLITCFGTLHHIPNVTLVLKELIRVLKPKGFLLIREPIISMGDWNFKRNGLTKNERGIPVSHFEKVINQEKSVQIMYRGFCFTMTSFLQKIFRKILKQPIYSYRWYIKFDSLISNLLKNNIKYHPHNKFDKIYPSNIFYIVTKR